MVVEEESWGKIKISVLIGTLFHGFCQILLHKLFYLLIKAVATLAATQYLLQVERRVINALSNNTN